MSQPARPAPGRSFASWRPSRAQVLVAALVAAAGFTYNGARILNDSPQRTTPVLDNLDIALPWLGLALLALMVAALSYRPVRWGWRSGALAEFWHAHRTEILLFAGILAFGVFMRVYRFQTSLPPANGLCCEESINGGVAYRALQGEWPLNFLITRWGSAAGFAVFGENTLGLRFFFVVMGIVTLIAFYFLLRELVSVPVALFGMALYAAAWWPSLRARQASEGTIYTVLFALVLVRGLKTKHPLWLLAAGVLAGLLSYEYEPFKAVPIIGALFLGGAAAREVLLRAPFSLDAALARARALAVEAWRPLVIALMATAVVLVPMIVGTHKGFDLYLTSVHRQEGGRAGERLADQWRTQLKWEAQIFLPAGPNDYPTSAPRDIPGRDLIDPLTAWLAVAGFAGGLVLALRGYRGLFAGWVVVQMGAGALLLEDFGPWKFIALVPVFIVLIAFLLDDARRLVVARFARRGALAFGALLAIGAAFSFWWNADMLFRQVKPSIGIVQGYGGEPAMIYTVCHDLQSRPKDNYAVAYSGDGGLDGFALRRDSFDAETRAWGDYIWICHDLLGTAVPAVEELWPLRDLPPGPLTIAIGDPPGSIDDAAAQLRQAYPSLGEPSRRGGGTREGHHYVEYDFPSPGALSTPGLAGQYSAGNDLRASRIDSVNDLDWDEAGLPFAPPFTVRWRGLVYLPAGGQAQLRALTTDGDPVVVLVDGQAVYDSEANTGRYVDFTAGWHTVDITLGKRSAGGNVRLVWATPESSERPVAAQDLFPMADLSGWVQERSLGLPGGTQQQTFQRIDVAPHLVSTAVVKALANTTTFEPIVTEERWRGVWHVEAAGEYVLRVNFQAGTVRLLIDGAEVASQQAPLVGQGELQAQASLEAGPHTIELVQELENDVPFAGLTFSAFAPGSQQPLQMNVTPY